jgi:predicted MPP superfamily phosphohydrolase
MISRRTFLRTTGLFSASGVLAGMYTWQVEPFWLEFVRRELPIVGLPKSLVGKTLIQISDIHVGNRFDYRFIIDSFKKASVLEPDIVVYTGDFVSWEDEQQLRQLREVMAHAVKGKLGTFAILGNHDYGHKWEEATVADEIVGVLSVADIHTLRNETVVVNGLHLTGIDDLWGTNFNPSSATSCIDPVAANLVLCHNPDVCDMDVWNGYRGWILSGHTHGGQCKPPFLPPPLLPVKNRRYTAGAFDLGDGRQLYINRALGHSQQVRFNVRPEITVFTLA